MKITVISWLEDVVQKLLRKHRVHQAEVAQTFAISPRFVFVEKGHRRGENVYAALGRSRAVLDCLLRVQEGQARFDPVRTGHDEFREEHV